ncbi:putative 4-hydroxybenzoate polyprenyltransferase [bacterium]|nr:putative 4-hydroxybenzoate polyprenyltransferase [bacterium]
MTFKAIRFEHSVFALPFALLMMFVAAGGWPAGRVFFWIVAACVAARSAAMAFNRLHDEKLDRLNPRTKEWPLASGRLSRRFLWGFLVIAVAAFVFAAGQLNRLALMLSPVALVVLLGYSTTKRWTRLSHFVMGAALGIAPSGAWIGVLGRLDWPPVLLGLGVMFWAGGFDIIYACQDEEFDRKMGLRSIPERFGRAKALRISAIVHAVAMMFFALVALADGLGLYYLAAVCVAGCLLIWEHAIVSPKDMSRLNAAFFTANGWVSMAIMVGGLMDLFWK